MKTNGDVKLQWGAVENTLNRLTPWRQRLRNQGLWEGEALKTLSTKESEGKRSGFGAVMWGLDDPAMSCAPAKTLRSSLAEISLLLTNLHLDKAIKPLPECN